MITQKNSSAPVISGPSMIKPMLLGAAIALVLIILFLSGVKHPNPAWPEYWKVRPFIVVPMAGAAGGFIYFLLYRLRRHGGWRMVLAHVLSLLGYIFALWMGTVAGLHGTLWN
jgi:hypothetical protein